MLLYYYYYLLFILLYLFREKKALLLNEITLRKKALLVENFPNQELIDEYLLRKDPVPKKIDIQWKQPHVNEFIVSFYMKLYNILIIYKYFNHIYKFIHIRHSWNDIYHGNHIMHLKKYFL